MNDASRPHHIMTTYAATSSRSTKARINAGTIVKVAAMTIRSSIVCQRDRRSPVTSPSVSAAPRNAPTLILVSAAIATRTQMPIDAGIPIR